MHYSITVPTDPRLPNSGQTLSGLYELIPSKASAVDNYTTFADDYGKQIEHWNGFDFTINARPGAGFTVQGGWSTGRTSVDNCDLRAKLPEITDCPPASPLVRVSRRRLASPRYPTASATSIPGSSTSTRPWGRTRCPKIDVQFGVTYQATPGPEINANYVVTQALTTPSTPLSGGLKIVNVIPPGRST